MRSAASPLVEGLSIDEAFLDVGGLRRLSGTPTEIAIRLRSEVRQRIGLPVSVGVARTKFLAKVASGVAKPDGLLEVPPDGELAFLHPLPVERLWGVGPVTAAKLRSRGIEKVRQGALLPEPLLVAMLAVTGGLINAVQTTMYALAAHVFPTEVRSTGVGFVVAVGRALDCRGCHSPPASGDPR